MKLHLLACVWCALLTVSAPCDAAAQDPALFTLRAEDLARAKRRLQEHDATLQPALDRLVSQADVALRAGPFSVMDKKRVPPSGDRHDYVSMGPYWWPDPAKPNGLPYIRKDGQRNPETEQDYDRPRLGRMLDAVNTLALAYYFTDREDYARHAAHLLRVWFLDPATRMNPNLEYAQAIPGITQGRGIGIIDVSGFPLLLDHIVLLRRSPSWRAADETGMQSWMRDFLHWLRTSRNGREEAAALNNHGTWYDAQVAAIAVFVGMPQHARAVLESSKTTRIARQITSDGRQPLELERTRSLSYSIGNLRGLMYLAEMGRKLGVDLWHYEAPGGGSIRKALDFLAPYADPAAKWPDEQITAVEPQALLVLLLLGERAYDDARYTELIAKIPPATARADRAQLLYPPRQVDGYGSSEILRRVYWLSVRQPRSSRATRSRGLTESKFRYPPDCHRR